MMFKIARHSHTVIVAVYCTRAGARHLQCYLITIFKRMFSWRYNLCTNPSMGLNSNEAAMKKADVTDYTHRSAANLCRIGQHVKVTTLKINYVKSDGLSISSAAYLLH